jgi:hypothetical protein
VTARSNRNARTRAQACRAPIHGRMFSGVRSAQRLAAQLVCLSRRGPTRAQALDRASSSHGLRSDSSAASSSPCNAEAGAVR